ncbi:hypothetical protein BKA93DRAFT_471978 [Sparassis latifolia]
MMTMLSRTLRWLARPKSARKKCFILVIPDPKEFIGDRVIGARNSYYLLRFGSRSVMHDLVGPGVGYSYNYGFLHRTRPPAVKYPQYSQWSRIIDTGKRTSEGKSVRDVLVEIIDAFPSHDLKSAEGIRKATEEIELKIGEVANSRSLYKKKKHKKN